MLPSSKAPSAIVYFVHGYGSHCNRPTYVVLFERLLALGVAVITIDLEGHGYSSGTALPPRLSFADQRSTVRYALLNP